MTLPLPPSSSTPPTGAAGPPLLPPPSGDEWHWGPPPEPEEEAAGPNVWEIPAQPEPAPEPEPQAASHAAADPSAHRIRLVFQSQQGVERGALLRLARWMGLDVWGDHLLNRRAAREMGSAALLLAVVLAFELMAWSMLFNVLVHAAQWTIGPRTLLALLLGGIFAAAVFLFEKSFITADASEAQWRIVIAYAIRAVVIVGSALATAQPIELLVFGGAIENRLYEENVLAEAVRQVGNFEDRQTKARGRSEEEIQKEVAGSGEYQTVQSTEKLYTAAYQEVLELEDDLTDAQGERTRTTERESYWQSELATAQRQRRSSNPASEYRVTRAVRNLDVARRRKATAQANLESVEERLGSARARLTTLADQLKAHRGNLDKFVAVERTQNQAEIQRNQALLEGIQDWMRFVQNARPGQVDPRTKSSLQARPADFTERLMVLDDLRNARPPLWPATTQKQRDLAVELFSVSDFKGPTSPALEEARERMEQKADLFRAIYWVAFIMALVIPLLTVAFKILMAGELRAYYSTLAQARAGNPAALEVVLARGQQVWGDRGADGGSAWRN
ncbi:MAG TPA: DUF4407 domain-containing protein [Thermoanaerobaculia bacterium]|nr:DUF4407 domain-containing protein [Thermoanaerobaculia bacterium]